MKTKLKGFTLIELLVVIAIIGLLSAVVLSSLNVARGKARDAQRLSDMHEIQTALVLYYTNHGTYPTSDALGTGGWETSGADTAAGFGFVKALVLDGDLPAGMIDPNPSWDTSSGNFNYYYYPAGYSGCTRSFYVIGIVQTDTSGTNKYPSSPGWSCGTENWQGFFSWVSGNYAGS